jgi:CRP-like cAMP-binding protein
MSPFRHLGAGETVATGHLPGKDRWRFWSVTFTRDEILQILEGGSWFATLPSDLRLTLVEQGRVQRYEKGQLISAEGTPSDGLFAVLEGQVAIMRWVDDDEPTLLSIAERGSWQRDFAALTREPSVVSFVAQSDASILLVPDAAVQRLLREDPRFFERLAHLVFERYALALRWIAEAQGLQPEELLRTRLADLLEMQRADDPEAEPEIRLSQQDIAALVGLSRQTANAILQRLEEKGLIEVGFRLIRVPNLEALRTGSG